MKVPKMYKSSDRYNAGTDVIYNDDSKLQYAPFIYATAESGDNGGGDDEEGEDTMKITITSADNVLTMDKTAGEIKEALNAGKFCYALLLDENDGTTSIVYIVEHTNSTILGAWGNSEENAVKFEAFPFEYTDETDYPSFTTTG